MAYIFTKTPFYDNNGKIIGTIFHGKNITNSNVFELGTLLSKMKSNIKNDLLGSQTSYLLTHQFSDVILSNREAECLFLMLRGKTIKLIAKYLQVSPRTIEEYVDQLKRKFHVYNKYDLIDKAIQTGFLNVIPKSLFHTQLSVILQES